MPEEKLKRTIKSVHQELSKTGELDEDLKELLRALDKDIDRVLAKQPLADDEDETMSERVEKMASRFSAEYPRLEMLLREVSDTLGKLGI
jgi:hypothetical protein